MTTLEDYAHWMRIATPGKCLYSNATEVHLIAKVYLLNIAVFEVDTHNSQGTF
jgi:hypothetical protein